MKGWENFTFVKIHAGDHCTKANNTCQRQICPFSLRWFLNFFHRITFHRILIAFFLQPTFMTCSDKHRTTLTLLTFPTPKRRSKKMREIFFIIMTNERKKKLCLFCYFTLFHTLLCHRFSATQVLMSIHWTSSCHVCHHPFAHMQRRIFSLWRKKK